MPEVSDIHFEDFPNMDDTPEELERYDSVLAEDGGLME